MSLFGRRLAMLRKARGLTQEELAHRLGVSRQQVVRWESGAHGTTQARLSAICETLGLTLTQFWDESWLPNSQQANLSNSGQELFESYPVGELVMVPLVAEIRAGLPREVIEATEERYPVDTSFVGRGDYFWLRVQGDSMVDAHIYPGDLVLIRLQPEAGNGTIVAAAIDGEGGTLKRFYRHGTSIMLVSENPKYPPQVFPAEKVRIVGVAVMTQRWLG